MAYIVSFHQKGEELLKITFEVAKGKSYMDHVAEAHETFRKKYPTIMLFDHVTVIYNKE